MRAMHEPLMLRMTGRVFSYFREIYFTPKQKFFPGIWRGLTILNLIFAITQNYCYKTLQLFFAEVLRDIFPDTHFFRSLLGGFPFSGRFAVWACVL